MSDPLQAPWSSSNFDQVRIEPESSHEPVREVDDQVDPWSTGSTKSSPVRWTGTGTIFDMDESAGSSHEYSGTSSGLASNSGDKGKAAARAEALPLVLGVAVVDFNHLVCICLSPVRPALQNAMVTGSLRSKV